MAFAGVICPGTVANLLAEVAIADAVAELKLPDAEPGPEPGVAEVSGCLADESCPDLPSFRASLDEPAAGVLVWRRLAPSWSALAFETPLSLPEF